LAGGTGFTVDPGQPDEEGASDVGAGYRFGYRLGSRVAMEVYAQGFTSVTSLFADVFDSADLYPTGNVGVAVLGELPLSGPLSAYGRLGIGKTYFTSDAAPEKDFSTTDPSVGLGLLLSPWRHVAFRLDFARYTRTDIITRQLAAEVRW
jgi:Outer membrane protein beta-barrel domain